MNEEIVDISPTDPKVLAAAKAYIEGEYKEGHAIELVDRIHTIIVMAEELLRDHPAAIKFGLNDKILAIDEALNNLYQEAGAFAFDE